MSTTLRSLLLIVTAGLTACGWHPKPVATAAPTPDVVAAVDPSPPPHPAIPELRTQGDLGARHQRIVDEARKGGSEIAFIGDSITEGWGGAGKAEWDKTWGPRHAINCGIGGDRTQHVLGRLDHDLLDALSQPNNAIKWVVLLIGTNNTGTPSGDSAEDIAAGVRAILDRLHDRLPGAQVALMAVFPRGEWPNPQRDTINALNVRLAAMAASDPKRIHYVDIGPKFLTPAGEIPHELMPDYLHLSPGGYAIWSEAVDRTLK